MLPPLAALRRPSKAAIVSSSLTRSRGVAAFLGEWRGVEALWMHPPRLASAADEIAAECVADAQIAVQGLAEWGSTILRGETSCRSGVVGEARVADVDVRRDSILLSCMGTEASFLVVVHGGSGSTARAVGDQMGGDRRLHCSVARRESDFVSVFSARALSAAGGAGRALAEGGRGARRGLDSGSSARGLRLLSAGPCARHVETGERALVSPWVLARREGSTFCRRDEEVGIERGEDIRTVVKPSTRSHNIPRGISLSQQRLGPGPFFFLIILAFHVVVVRPASPPETSFFLQL
ncbi:hypothetical protein B0H10DRAFT_1937992 [Mycena sp. CBHHK59/15]|nr:hypothetical protein B0H10DRAFT_1937992 [Mycena sp. CBHHK59/15]